jgi:hypothetical protein
VIEVPLTGAVTRFEEDFEGDEGLLATLASVKAFVVVGAAEVDCGRLGNMPLDAGWLVAFDASIGFMDENKLLVLGCVGVPFSNLRRTSLSIKGPSTSIEGRIESASGSFADPNVDEVD